MSLSEVLRNRAVSLWGLRPTIKSWIGIILLSALSPTWAIARYQKSRTGPHDRTRGIILRNYLYAGFSLFALWLLGQYLAEQSSWPAWFIYVAYTVAYIFAWSRSNEIMIAFLSDALDKSARLPSKSTLKSRKRIELALVSYLELMLNFAFLFLLLGQAGSGKLPTNAIDAFYFSGVTITTLGYGDFSPDTLWTKLLVIQEVLAGFALLIVSFAIYAGKEVNVNRSLSPDSVSPKEGWSAITVNIGDVSISESILELAIKEST